jgi:aryl-alcohol dehydrogenase-like predicted oxidoreductase
MMKKIKDSSSMNRRQFILKTSLSTMVLPSIIVSSRAVSGESKNSFTPQWRNKQSDMSYRMLGRTGYMISEVVCGGDPVSPETYKQVELAMEMGLNYLDTAPAYGRGNSEKGYGEILKSSSKREKVFINTKISGFTSIRNRMYREIYDSLPSGKQESILKTAWQMRSDRGVDKPGYFYIYWPGQERSMDPSYLSNAMMKDYGHKVDGSKEFKEFIFNSIEGSLQRTKTDYFDLAMCPHGANCPEEVNIPEVYEAFDELKRQGKVRYLGVSSHNDPAGVLSAAVDTGKYDVAMVAYNFLNDGFLDGAIRKAYDAKIGVIGMKVAMSVATQHEQLKPLPEWREEKLNKIVPGDLKAPLKAYLWALQNPRLSAVISNLWDEDHVKENLSVAGRKIELEKG